MQPSEMKRDAIVFHPELGELRLAFPVGPHRFLPDGSAVSLVAELARVLIDIGGAARLVAEEEGRVLEPVLSNDLQHTGRFLDGDPCATWYAINAAWEQVIVHAAHVEAK